LIKAWASTEAHASSVICEKLAWHAGENRLAKLMQVAQIKSVRCYKRPRYKVGKPALVAPNQLQRQFQHAEPDLA